MDTSKTHDPGADDLARFCPALKTALDSIAGGDRLDGLFFSEIDARDVAIIMRRRLTERQRIYLTAAGLWSLPASVAGDLATAAADDCRAGEPVPALGSIKVAADDWAYFATRLEHQMYLVACWNQLSQADRREFLRAIPKQRGVA